MLSAIYMLNVIESSSTCCHESISL